MALSFDYASNHAERELKCAAWQAASLGIEHRVIDISSISSHLKSALISGADDIPDGSYDEELMKQTVVPFRNGIFLSIAAGVAESCGCSSSSLRPIPGTTASIRTAGRNSWPP